MDVVRCSRGSISYAILFGHMPVLKNIYIYGVGGEAFCLSLLTRPRIKRDYPLNLSISLSGGKETNKDFLSNGE